MRVEGLEDILRDQTVVDALVLVLFELRELVLPYVHHVAMCIACGQAMCEDE